MTSDEALDQMRAQLAEHGEDIEIRRYAGTGNARGVADRAIARGRPLGMGSRELIGETVQGTRKVIIVNDPIAPVGAGCVALAAMLPLSTSDKLFFRNREVAISDIDDDTRRINGVLIGLDIMTRG
jgi:hypothetical protein